MPTKIELKAYCGSPAAARQALQALPARLVETSRQVDTYFYARHGALKLRESDTAPPRLISYRRLNAPTASANEYVMAELGGGGNEVKAALGAALGTYAVVTKTRETYQYKASSIHLDEVALLGSFLEVEVPAELTAGAAGPAGEAAELQAALQITAGSILPWSYSDLLTLRGAAARWREQLAARPGHGKVVLIDGASGTGKSTILRELFSGSAEKLRLVPRATTREPRGEADLEQSQMEFVSPEAFQRRIMAGELIEYRDFLFGMSYGLPWRPAIEAALAGRTAVGLINLGNGPHVKRFFPEATTVLVDAPLADIRQRLLARGTHTPEQLEERIANARTAKGYSAAYDHLILNPDGGFDAALRQLRAVIE